MNRRRTFLTASALTLVFGVAPATVWVLRQRLSPGKRTSNDIPLAAAQVVSAAEQPPDTSALDKVFTKDDSLSYKGYRVEKSQTKGEDSWFATLKKGNKTVAKFEAGWNKEWTNFGLFPFISNEPKQLVVEQYSGGAHCCYSYWIYDLSGASARLLFENDKYGTGNLLIPSDLDGDGAFEFRHSVMAFDYFHMSHASSIFPQAVFAYDKLAGEYRPANRRFSAYALDGIEGDIKELETLKAGGKSDGDDLYTERHFSAVLQVTLKYIYAGKRDEGWSFFEREYRTHEGIAKEKMRAEIEETLSAEPVYKYIYSTGSK
jgi:hypothetical protein